MFITPVGRATTGQTDRQTDRQRDRQRTWPPCVECTSEMCCTRLAALAQNTGCKIRRLQTVAQSCRAISSQLRNVSTIGKNLLNSNISSRCPYNMVNVGLLTAEIGWRVWQISTGFASWLRYCNDVAQQRSATLCMMFGRLLG